MHNKKGVAVIGVLLLVLAVIGGLSAGKWAMDNWDNWFGGEKDALSVAGDKAAGQSDENVAVVHTVDVGDAGTLYLEGYTGSWGDAGARAEVYPTYTVMNDGVTIVNDAQANSTSKVKAGDVLDVYGTGASYYVDPLEGYVMDGETASVELDAYAVVATTDLVITVYDKDENALTADDDDENTADYAGGNVLANDMETYYAKLEQTGADKSFQLFGICTYILGDEADDFELVEKGWKEVNVPEKLDDTSITLADDGLANTTEKGFKHCYIPEDEEPIHLQENDDTDKIKFVFDSDDSTQPAANGDTYFGAVFMDGSYSVDKDGNVEFGFFMDDDTEDPGAVGIDENPETTVNGLDTAFAVEPQ
ncbi:hypothetical protein D1BOALGB6SA_4977 [Olavius sp. associated proteobacterium Delta 1]|nr:hypothetical protein D1BOALGB6SA_4977 [Olavius sp. associated proteobacterium Delta 1]